MKKLFVLFVSAGFLTASFNSCEVTKNCHSYANYTAVNDQAYACVYCDSVTKSALQFFKNHFPIKNKGK